jgi:AcrR family transcriptional regulator
VSAALELSAGKSLEEISMRSVASHLGVPVMTIYNYVPNKAALYELVQTRILEGVEVPQREAGSWEDRMRMLQRDARAAVAERAGMRVGSGLARSVESARLADGVRDILVDAGFAPDEIALAFTTLFTFMLGQFEIDAIAASAGSRVGVDLLMPADVAPPSVEDSFEYAFDVVLAGLNVRLGRGGGRRR